MFEHVIHFFKRPAQQAGGKESDMAEAKDTTATPPATSGGVANGALTKEDVKGMIAEAIGPISQALSGVSEGQKGIAELLNKLGSAGGAGAAGKEAKKEEAKALTAEDIDALIEKRLKAQSDTQASAAKRAEFIAANLAKLPKAYQGQLGSDPAKWAEEAKAIQSQFEADFKGAGGKPETLSSATTDGGKTAAQHQPDTSKMPAFERIHRGLEKFPVPSEAQAAEKKS